MQLATDIQHHHHHQTPWAYARQGEVLIAESDVRFASGLTHFLNQLGFSARVRSTLHAVLADVRENKPDLVIVRPQTADARGVTLCRSLRQEYQGAILVLPESHDHSTEVACLEAGADDFVSESAGAAVLHARIRALLRRSSPPTASQPESASSQISFGDFSVDPEIRIATFRGRRLPFTDAEFSLLLYLCRNPDRTIERAELHRKVRGVAYESYDRAIDLRVSRLRSKLRQAGAVPIRIESVRGVGYVLVSEQR
jgi:two-component system response regulator RstA